MNIDRLLEYLELDEPRQFEFFENMADLIEADAVISPEAIYELFSGMEMSVFAQLLDSYFEETLEAMPGDSVEIYTLLETVKMALIGMATHIEEENDMVLLADEFYRFRTWFSLDSKVWVQECFALEDKGKALSIRDALILSRMEKLGGVKFDYNFDDSVDFEMDQYTVSFADLAAEEKLKLQEEYSEDAYAYIDEEISPEDLH